MFTVLTRVGGTRVLYGSQLGHPYPDPPPRLSPKVARLKNFIDTRRIFTGQVFPTRYDLDLAPCFRSGVPRLKIPIVIGWPDKAILIPVSPLPGRAMGRHYFLNSVSRGNVRLPPDTLYVKRDRKF